MKLKELDTIIYKDSSFDELVERFFLLDLQLKEEKKLNKVDITLSATIWPEKKQVSFLRRIFGRAKKVEPENYNPYETLNLEFSDLEQLPYSFSSLLEAIRQQYPRFGEVHVIWLSLFPSKKAHRSSDMNDIQIWTEYIGEKQEHMENLWNLRAMQGTNRGVNIYASIPAAYEKEFFRLEKNLVSAKVE